MSVSLGFSEAERPRIAELYWAAFADKLGAVLGPRTRGEAFVRRVADPSHALAYRNAAGAILGVAGFKTHSGAFVGGDLTDLAAVYGRWGGLWRGLALSLLERDTENRRFLMDGICVAEEARGRGIGTALLEGVAREAVARGFGEIRLDVIDRNARARALYERRGFVEAGTQKTGIVAPLFGFQASTTMVRRVN